MFSKSDSEVAHLGSRKNIAKLRHKEGLTQEELAKLSEISAGYLAAIEEERKFPHIKTLARLANCLGVTIDDLLKEE